MRSSYKNRKNKLFDSRSQSRRRLKSTFTQTKKVQLFQIPGKHDFNRENIKKYIKNRTNKEKRPFDY